jgi:hypothetical protein
MPKRDYNRYAQLIKSDGTTDLMPFVNLPFNPSDKYETWNTQYSRLDKLSQKYYGNPFYDFLILYANPSFVSEWDIPDGYLIRVPFPLQKVKADYENALTTFRLQYD